MTITARHPRFRVTLTGSALHTPNCTALPENQVVALTIDEARDWLAAGDRRFPCRVCKPADPRHIGVVQ